MNILVTGGAGYIGSHAVKQLLDANNKVVVVDNCCRGHKQAVDPRATLYCFDLDQTVLVRDLLTDHNIECVMHFAALTYVGESVASPLYYYDNNVAGTISLLRAMHAAKINRMIFSSTAATYGETVKQITELTRQNPINPYGRSKLFIEHILRDYAASNGDFAFAALRYFNVAGCAVDGSIGEDHTPETHLIPVAILTALGKRSGITVFGTDYPTIDCTGVPDGTCIRDYVHVEDLCAAHILAMEALYPGDQRFYNIGIGHGYSVREIIEATKHITGIDFKVEYGCRREGDPAILFANADKIRHELGWSPQYVEIDDIIRTAWNWFRVHPEGYENNVK